jgi:hypothetical protein
MIARARSQERAAAGVNVANVVLLRGCGSRIRVPGFYAVHGMKPCLVAPTKIIAGQCMGVRLGMQAWVAGRLLAWHALHVLGVGGSMYTSPIRLCVRCGQHVHPCLDAEAPASLSACRPGHVV